VPDENVGNFQTVGDVLDELRRTGIRDEGFSAVEAVESVRSGLPYSDRPAVDKAVMGLSFSGMKLFFKSYFGLKLMNVEHLPSEGAYIIAANHSSHLDTAAMITALTAALGKRNAQRLHVIGARDYFFNSPFKSWLFSTCLNVVPIERDEISLAGLRQIRSILSRNEPILIFPEGTRSRTGALQAFKPGIGLIAHDTGVPIVPAWVEGTYTALPPGKMLPRKNQVTVSFGQQILMDQYNLDSETMANDQIYRMITSDVRDAIKRLAGGAPG
jgi:long-chain acyl-CoA synthetase